MFAEVGDVTSEGVSMSEAHIVKRVFFLCTVVFSSVALCLALSIEHYCAPYAVEQMRGMGMQDPLLWDGGNAKEVQKTNDIILMLLCFGQNAIPPLIGALQDNDIQMRRNACYALGSFGTLGWLCHPWLDTHAALPSLIRATGDHDAGVRSEAANALGKIGPAASNAVPALIEMLKGPETDRGIRLSAARALGKIGPTADAISALVPLLKDPERDIHEQSAYILGEYGPYASSAIPALTEAHRDDKSNFSRIVGVAIEKISGHAAIPKLPAINARK
jgi:HEAT repeat protein